LRGSFRGCSFDIAAPVGNGAAARAMIAPQTGAHLRAEPVEFERAGGDVPVQVRSYRSRAFAVLTLALGLYGCANADVFDTNERWFQKPFDFTGRNGGYTFSELQETNSKRGSVAANQMVDASGACPAMPAANPVAAPVAAAGPAGPDAAGPGAPDPLLGGGIALGMTECDVVYRAGAPSNVQIGTNPNGARSLVLTYNGGPRPGTYRFEAGRLMDMDRVEVAEPKPAAKPKKAKLAKKKPAAPKQVSTE
jgi:hypothetical protein